MNFKKILLCVIIVLIIVAGIGIFYDSFIATKEFKLGDTYFNMPSGFHQEGCETTDKYDLTNISDGKCVIGMYEYRNNNITNIMNHYVSEKNKDNYSVQIVNSTVNGIVIHKSVILNDISNVHYWFVYNDIGYEFYTWDANNDTDNIVANLVKTMKKSS